MPVFEIEADGKLFEIDAPDQATAVKAFASMVGQDAPAAETPDHPEAAPQSNGFLDTMNAIQRGAMQGMTFGFADEINAGLGALPTAALDAVTGRGFDVGRAYNEGLEFNRGADTAAAEAAPIAAVGGDVVGSLLTGGALAKGGVTLMNAAKPTVASLAGRGAVEGALYGAVSGAGRSEGDSLSERGLDAVYGAGGGALTGGAVGGVAGALMGRQAAKAVPTVDDLKGQASALYDAAAAKGVTFPQPAVKTLADDIAATVISEGIDPTLHPRATAALQRLQHAGTTGMTVKDAQTLRRVVASAGKDYTNPDEARIASIMIDKLDDFVGQAAPELAQARSVYHQAKKGEMIEQAIELAGSRAGQFSGSGFENALRTEFRALERKIIKGQLKGLTQAEIEAIKKVAQGGPIENAMRLLGKLAPTGVVSFGAGAGVPFMVGNAMGGPAVGAAAAGATMGAGLLGRGAATAMTRNNALVAALLARSGGAPVGPVNASQQALARLLSASSGNEGGSLSLRAGRPAVAQELISLGQ